MNVLISALGGLAAILFVVFGVVYSAHKQQSIWLLFFPAVLLSTVAICFAWQKAVAFEIENPPFSAAIETAWVGDKRDAIQIFCLYNRNMMSPVSVSLFVRLVNLQDVPSRISVLKIEIESKRGRWIFPDTWMPTKEIPHEMPLIWLNPPPTPARQMDFVGPRLGPILEKGPIAPHDTVSGWVLLSVPAEYDSAPRPLRFRITIKDTAGRTFTKIDSGPTGEENIFSNRGLDIREEVNVQGFSISHWFFK